MPQSQRVKQIVMISCNGWMGQLKPLAENLVPWSLSDLVQHYNNCFSEGDLPFSYGEIVLLSQAHPSMLIASGQKKSVNSVFAGLAGRWEQTFLMQFLLFLLWDPSTQQWQWAVESCHPSCVWMWKQHLPGHWWWQPGENYLGTRSTEVLHSHLVPDVCLYLAAGVMPALGWVWKKGFGQLKAGWGRGSGLAAPQCLTGFSYSTSLKGLGVLLQHPWAALWSVRRLPPNYSSFLTSIWNMWGSGLTRAWHEQSQKHASEHGKYALPGKSGQEHNWSKSDMDHRVRIMISPTLPPSCN